ncbi:MAG: serine/threonine protein kinase, partial [Deltaproteobacteria bacterium]|nr:serine/threonine protein kinase [Deltaproteobacteria bacterium]
MHTRSAVPSDDPATPKPGTRFGDYLLGDKIAAGGMAEVFHAEPLKRRFEGPIVVKHMLPSLAGNKDFVSMFIDEARISTRLDHPNIVQVHDFEATDRGLFLVMELIDGPDLLSVLSRCATAQRPFDAELAVYVACHVLEALDYAHGAALPNGKHLHVVHRDVSPSNILLSRRGHVKLADFGIARAAAMGQTQEMASGTLKGKFGYMSPEQVRGDKLDGRSDVFSLAIVLAEMLMTRRLFAAPNDVELLLMVRRGDLSRLDKYGASIPPALRAIVRKALSVDRETRYENAGAFRDALADWLAGCGRRTGAARLADLLRELERDGDVLCASTRRRASNKSSTTISGKQTVMARLAATDAAKLGRLAFARGDGPKDDVPDHEHVMLARFHGSASPTPTPVRPATPRAFSLDESGTLDPVMVIDLLCEIARTNRTGALVIRSGDSFKEAYFRAGQPVFVRCNVPEDRFGEFLVKRRVITRDQLERTLNVLGHFKGRLGQALVSLDLLTPVDAVRLLAAQVSHKLISACSWHTGSYEFRDGEHNPWPALELQIRTSSIIGKGLGAIPMERLIFWAERIRE